MSELLINIGFGILAVIGNIGFGILAVIGVYEVVLIIKHIILKHYNEFKRHRDDAMTDFMKVQADKELEDWILKERFIKDLDNQKAKADDFNRQVDMQSTERDSEQYKSLYLVKEK